MTDRPSQFESILARKPFALKSDFLAGCALATWRIHAPLRYPNTAGHVNPLGLDDPRAEPFAPRGQSTVAFSSVAAYEHADQSGYAGEYKSREYGIPGTKEVLAVCDKFTALHNAAGAALLPSRRAALAAVFEKFLRADHATILVPDSDCDSAIFEILHAIALERSDLAVRFYAQDAGSVAEKCDALGKSGRPVNMIYMQTPNAGAVVAAQARGIRTVLGGDVDYSALMNGCDIAVHEISPGTDGVTPPGIALARRADDAAALARKTRVFGTGAVAPESCAALPVPRRARPDQAETIKAVCDKFTALHDGAGAVLLPSGLAALGAVFKTVLPAKNATILIPDNCYGPVPRLLGDLARDERTGLEWHRYPARASGAEVAALCDRLAANGRPVSLVHIEAPGSQTFEIPDIDGIVAAAEARDISTSLDNSWASHVRFRPLAHGVRYAIQATTKYEGGYGDTPSGVVIARDEEDYRRLAARMAVTGLDAVAPETARRLLHRVEKTGERLTQQAASAGQLMGWFARQDAVAEILCPARPDSPDHTRFKQYFDGGNGLFTVRFRPETDAQQIRNFLDRLQLIHIGESWGGHVSLALIARPDREFPVLAPGTLVRFSAGLEDADDLVRDLRQAAGAFASAHVKPQRVPRL